MSAKGLCRAAKPSWLRWFSDDLFRLLIHEAVALDRHAVVRAQRAIFTEEEPTIFHIVHQEHPEPGGEREEGGPLAAALTQPAAMVCRQIVQEHRRLLRHRAIVLEYTVSTVYTVTGNYQ